MDASWLPQPFKRARHASNQLVRFWKPEGTLKVGESVRISIKLVRVDSFISIH